GREAGCASLLHRPLWSRGRGCPLVTPDHALELSPRYDEIGRSYGRYRRSDPQVARQITAALCDANRIVDVGAGAGSYEPAGRHVVAVEPSPVMIAQRPSRAGAVVRGVAEALPFPSDSFDASLAILSLH